MITESNWYALHALLKGDCTGSELLSAVNSNATEKVSSGNFHNHTLTLMVQYGIVEVSSDCQPSRRKNGRPERLYRITEKGVKEIARQRLTIERMLNAQKESELLESENLRKVAMGLKGW